MNYKKTYNLMRKFYNLSINEVKIMDYLMDKEYVEITYTKLTEEIGLDKKMSSNVRKAIIHLQELKIVCIVNKYDNKKYMNPMKACFIVDGWMDNLLNAKF